jgi:hypothetical protein
LTLKDLLTETLMARFQDRGPQPGSGSEEVVEFPAAHPVVGNLRVEASEGEATVFVGDITHGHFDQFNSPLPPGQVALNIVEEVVDFLEELFADRALLWLAADGRSGGWQVPFDRSMPADLPPGAKTFVWSGPLPEVSHARPAG